MLQNFVSQVCLISARLFFFLSLHAGINEPINSVWENLPVFCSMRCFVSCILQRSCGVLWQESLKSGVWCHFNHLHQLVWIVNTSPPGSGNLTMMLNKSYLSMGFIRLCIIKINLTPMSCILNCFPITVIVKNNWRSSVLMNCEEYTVSDSA